MSTQTEGFIKALFMGNILTPTLFPYPHEGFDAGFLDMVDAVGKFTGSVDSRKIDEDHALSEDVLQGMKDMGLFGLIIDEKYGGLGFNMSQYCRVIEELSRHDPSISITIGAHLSIGMKGLHLYGTQAQKDKYMPKLASGEMIAAFALTEPGSGSDAASMRTKAVADGDGYRLTGEKLWITNGGIGDFFTVFATTPGELKGKKPVTAFIVERSMKGFSSGKEEDKMGLRGSSTTPLSFDNMYVPKENILGEVGQGFRIALQILNQGRLGLAASCLGTIKKAIELATDHAKERKQFGQPLIAFELTQNKLAQMHADLFGLESMIYATSALIDKGEKDYSYETAACKSVATDLAWTHMNQALQIAGGIGYMREYPYERYVRDIRINMIFEGANEIMRLMIGQGGLFQVGQHLATAPSQHPTFETLSAKKAPQPFVPWVELLNERTQQLYSVSTRLLHKFGQDIKHRQAQAYRCAAVAENLYLLSCSISRAMHLWNSSSVTDDQKTMIESYMTLLGEHIRSESKSCLNKVEYNHDDIVRSLFDKELATEGYLL